MSEHTSLSSIALVVLCTLIVTAAQALMKHGLNTTTTLFGAATSIFVLSGVFLMVIGGILLTLALKNGELSVLHPLLSLGFIWVILISGFLGETVSDAQIVGVASIVIGVSVIGRTRRKK